MAFSNGILKSDRCEEIPAANNLVEDFLKKIMTNLYEFNIRENFDYCKFNLLEYAYIYAYGKGAENTFYSELGYEVKCIDYNFDKLMEGKFGDALPKHLHDKLTAKLDIMLEIYSQMFDLTCISHEKMIEEKTNFEYCIQEILNFAYYCGQELCKTDQITEEDKKFEYHEFCDAPYDANNYTHKYKLENEM
jgi:hypothetical protein